MACVLGLTAWLLLKSRRAPAPPAPTHRAWMSAADASDVKEVRVRWPGDSQPVTVRRLADTKHFVIDQGPRGSFLAREEQVRGALRLLAELDSLPAADSSPPFDGVQITVVADQERSVELSPYTLAGGTAVRMLDPAGVRVVMAAISLRDVFAIEGLRAWRDDALITQATGEPTAIRIDRDGRALELVRARQRWGVVTPLVAPAEPEMCIEALARLASVTTRTSTRSPAEVESLPTIMVVATETPIRGADRDRSLRQSVRVFDGGGRLLGVSRATTLENGKETSAWGPFTVELDPDAISAISAEVGPFLSRLASQLVAADVQGVRVGEIGMEAWRGDYSRTIDGWAAGGKPALPADQEGLKALLALLCDTRASAATLDPPANTKPFARVSLLTGGLEAEAFEFSTATIPLETYAAPALIVRLGKVHRVYPAGSHEAVINWLREKTVPEG